MTRRMPSRSSCRAFPVNLLTADLDDDVAALACVFLQFMDLAVGSCLAVDTRTRMATGMGDVGAGAMKKSSDFRGTVFGRFWEVLDGVREARNSATIILGQVDAEGRLSPIPGKCRTSHRWLGSIHSPDIRSFCVI